MGKSRLVCSLGILGFMATALGAEVESRGQQAMAELDTDGDGVVSFSEFQVRGVAAVANLDTDQDGVLTIEEFLNARQARGFGNRQNREAREDGRPPREISEEQRARMQEMMSQRATDQFQAMDANSDGTVTSDEFQEWAFTNLDRDNDGTLTAQELRAQPGGRQGFGRRGRGPAPQN